MGKVERERKQAHALSLLRPLSLHLAHTKQSMRNKCVLSCTRLPREATYAHQSMHNRTHTHTKTREDSRQNTHTKVCTRRLMRTPKHEKTLGEDSKLACILWCAYAQFLPTTDSLQLSRACALFLVHPLLPPHTHGRTGGQTFPVWL